MLSFKLVECAKSWKVKKLTTINGMLLSHSMLISSHKNSHFLSKECHINIRIEGWLIFTVVSIDLFRSHFVCFCIVEYKTKLSIFKHTQDRISLPKMYFCPKRANKMINYTVQQWTKQVRDKKEMLLSFSIGTFLTNYEDRTWWFSLAELGWLLKQWYPPVNYYIELTLRV